MPGSAQGCHRAIIDILVFILSSQVLLTSRLREVVVEEESRVIQEDGRVWTPRDTLQLGVHKDNISNQ